VAGLADGGQRDGGGRGEFDVVVTDDGHLLGHLHAEPDEFVDHADGEQVVRAENGGGGRGQPQQAVCRVLARGRGQRRLVDRDHRAAGHSAQRQVGAVAAFPARLRLGLAGDQGEPAVPEAGQVADGDDAPGFMIDSGGAGVDARVAAIEHHDGHSAGAEPGDSVGLHVDRRDEHAGDALLLEEVEAALFLAGRAVARAQDRVETVGVHGRLGAPGDIGEVGVGDVLDDHPEGAAVALTEPPRRLVAHEPELVDRRTHPGTGSFGHQIWPI
jgi:hypothetical protein